MSTRDTIAIGENWHLFEDIGAEYPGDWLQVENTEVYIDDCPKTPEGKAEEVDVKLPPELMAIFKRVLPGECRGPLVQAKKVDSVKIHHKLVEQGKLGDTSFECVLTAEGEYAVIIEANDHHPGGTFVVDAYELVRACTRFL